MTKNINAARNKTVIRALEQVSKDINTMLDCDELCVSGSAAARLYELQADIHQMMNTRRGEICMNQEPADHSPGLIERLWHFIENGAHPYNGGFNALREAVRGKKRLAIILEGGLVQGIVSDQADTFKGAQIAIVDYDIEGRCDDELTNVPQEGGGEVPACIHYDDIFTAGIDLDAVFKD